MKRAKFYNSPVVGIILSLIVNILFVFVLINIGDYLSVSKKGFVIVVSSISLLALFVNGLFIWGFAYRNKFVRKSFVIFSSILVLIFGLAISYTYRLNRGLGNLIDKDNHEFINYSFVTVDEAIGLDNFVADDKIAYVEGDLEFNEAVEAEIAKYSTAIQVVRYERYEDLLKDLIEEETLNVAVLPQRFTSFAEGMSDKAKEQLEETFVIHNFNIKVQNEELGSAKVLEEPFSILLTGINGNLSDSIILATINPKTLDVTMTSIARDSFVPISCYPGQSYDKINHSRGRSRQCLTDTIENLLDIEIDFFIETDFYALVKITDVLGGLELESPVAFGGSLPKEDNPNEYHEVFIQKGKQHMNGYQVITFARERHHFGSGDFQRQLNQQYVIKELASKIFTESRKNVDTIIRVIRAAEDNIVMNLSIEKDISPLLGLAINNISASPVGAIDTFNIRSTQLQGTSEMINGVSYMIPYEKSLRDIKAMLKQNLSGDIATPQKESFDFSMNHPYDYGNGVKLGNYYGTSTITDPSEHQKEPETVNIPDFTTMSLDEIKSWANKYGIELGITEITVGHPAYNDHYTDGQIIYQSVDPGETDGYPEYMEVSIVVKPKEPEVPVEPVEPVEPEPDPEVPVDPPPEEPETPEEGTGEENPPSNNE